MADRFLGALTLSVAFAVLAGCGGRRLPTGAPGLMPQTSAVGQHAGRVKSRMLSKAASQDFLYASTLGGGDVYIFSYPALKLVGTAKGLNWDANGECVDKAGDVFVTTRNVSDGQSTIFEFTHGGTTPVASLADPGAAEACSVDPTTGNLAVANQADDSNPSNSGDIAIYAGSQGVPKIYIDPNMSVMLFCTYDATGNLFVDNEYGQFAELPNGSSNFSSIKIKGADTSVFVFGPLQWDGRHIALTIFSTARPRVIDRVRVSGTVGRVVGTTTLSGEKRFIGQDWITGNKVIALEDNSRQIGIWSYPSGGSARAISRSPKGALLWGLTLSVAPSPRT